MEKKKKLTKIVLYALLIALSLFMLVPFYWMVISSLKLNKDVFSIPMRWWPETMHPENYSVIWKKLPLVTFFANTTKLTVCTTIIQLCTSCFAAYGFTKCRFKGRDTLFLMYVTTIAVPWQVYMVPQFIMVSKMGLNDTHLGLILMQAFSAFGVFLIRQFYISIPDELCEAARIDGLNEFGIFRRIIFPLGKPAMATLTAATGSVTGAAVRQGVTVLFSDLLITAVDSLLVPLVYAYIALSCAQAALGNGGLGKLAGLVRGTAVFFLTAMLLAFTGYLTASGAIAGSVDAAVVKTARMTISRAVPVVGGILSDAAESALASTSVLRSTVGVVGMLVVLAICLTPFLQLALHYLAYKLAAALAGTVDHSRLGALMDSIGGAFGLLLGMTGSCALMLLLSIVSAVSAVAP